MVAEGFNMEQRLMTLSEQAAVIRKANDLRKTGKTAEASALEKTIPVPAYLAKVFKEKAGAEFLIQGGWNLAEAEAEFGMDWLAR
jgi:hypothetical protein